MQAFVIDAFAFCQNHEQREGTSKITDFPRLLGESTKLVDGSDRGDDDSAELSWSLQGGIEKLGFPKLVLTVNTKMHLMCQRCLTSFEMEIDSYSELILAKNEEHADEIESMLDENEVDVVEVVVGSKVFNVNDLIEDEVLLAIPQSPKHAVCPDVLLASSASSVGSAAANNDSDIASDNTGKKVSPFAVLKKLQ